MTGEWSAGEVQRGCALLAVALSDGRRQDARLVTGEHRAFGLNALRAVVNVPHPYLSPGWSSRTMTCGVALQCSPSKDRIAAFRLHELSERAAGAGADRGSGGVGLDRLAMGRPAVRVSPGPRSSRGR